MYATIKKVFTTLGLTVGVLTILGMAKKPGSVYKDKPSEQNPFEGKRVKFIPSSADDMNADGVRGHLIPVSEDERLSAEEEQSNRSNNIADIPQRHIFYERVVKRGLDIVLSFVAMVILSPLFLIISTAIYFDDPGPVLFTQKRVGKNKQYFRLHKFRSMCLDTPHDTPTHQLINPERYITRVGKFIRKHSIDELPQIWDIWIGNMSVIGPRPALWNQDKLVALRDEAGANETVPGLTGLAQISGRDELELEEKSELDGKYCRNISFGMDCKCFFGTMKSVLKHDGVVEGGTGTYT